MKKITVFAMLCAALLILAGCGGSEDPGCRDDVAAADIAEQVCTALGKDDMVAMDDTYLQNAMQLDSSEFSDYAVMVNSKGANIDEFGIFKAGDSGVSAAEEAVRGYLQFRLDTWIPEYMPEELPKLENAGVRVCGNYVMYAILSDSEAETAFSEFESALEA